MMTVEYIRPFDSHIEAFNAGYDMGCDFRDGAHIKVAEISHMVKRLNQTQLEHGPNQALSALAVSLTAIEEEADRLEQMDKFAEVD